jgi:membrane AbrB-like protein
MTNIQKPKLRDAIQGVLKSPTCIWLLTYSIAIISGYAASYLNIPLPWMLGPLLVIAFLCVFGVDLQAPAAGRYTGQWLIATAIGLTFSPMVVQELIRDFPFIVLVCFGSLLMLGFGTWFLWRIFKIPMGTAFFSAALGGASEMTTLADRHHQRADLVAAAHSLRLLIVLCVVPILFQIWGTPGDFELNTMNRSFSLQGAITLFLGSLFGILIFRFLNLPNGFLLGPLLMVAAMATFDIELTAWPKPLSNAAQLLLGTSLGVRFSKKFIAHAKNLVVGTSLYTLICTCFSFLLAILIEHLSDLDLETLILSNVPGGMAEMGITAKVFQLNVPVVTIFHIFRMVFVILTAEWIYKRILVRFDRPHSKKE